LNVESQFTDIVTKIDPYVNCCSTTRFLAFLVEKSLA